MTSPEPPPRLSAPPRLDDPYRRLNEISDYAARTGHQSPVPTPDFPIYRKGARVTHLDHGRGTVVETNTSTSVVVQFDEFSGPITMHWHDVTKIGVPQPDESAQ